MHVFLGILASPSVTISLEHSVRHFAFQCTELSHLDTIGHGILNILRTNTLCPQQLQLVALAAAVFPHCIALQAASLGYYVLSILWGAVASPGVAELLYCCTAVNQMFTVVVRSG